MDVKEAIGKAKTYVAETFSDDKPRNIGLEEVRFDDRRNAWLITIGFSRPWDTTKPFAGVLAKDIDLNRTYKVVRVDDQNGSVISVTNRDVEVVEG